MKKEYSYLETVHQSDYDLLCEVDRVCKKNEIQYFLHGGTFLGAVRHQDIIPWDDDVDISMKRADYERFIEVFEKDADSRFKLLKFEDYPQFFDFISKIADTSVTYEKTVYGDEDFYENRFSHPTLDIFVMDQVGSHHGLQLLKLKALYSLAMGHRKAVDYSKFTGAAKAAAHIMTAIGRCIPFERTASLYKKVQKEGNHPGDAKKLFLSNEQPDPRYWGLEYASEMYDGSSYATIRDRIFPAPGNYDSWLSMVYGDYMTLPPEDKRVPQHIITIRSK